MNKLTNQIKELQEQSAWLHQYTKNSNQCDISKNTLAAIQIALSEYVESHLNKEEIEEFSEFIGDLINDVNYKISYIVNNPEFKGDNQVLNQILNKTNE